MGETDRPEPSSLLARAHVLVAGRVQGVFYRASAAREATSRGLAGWVGNRPDGRVEAVFQGDRSAVEALIAWCEHGPPMAAVEGVEVVWEEPDPAERPFGWR